MCLHDITKVMRTCPMITIRIMEENSKVIFISEHRNLVKRMLGKPQSGTEA